MAKLTRDDLTAVVALIDNLSDVRGNHDLQIEGGTVITEDRDEFGIIDYDLDLEQYVFLT
jgi:hypothetical protein